VIILKKILIGLISIAVLAGFVAAPTFAAVKDDLVKEQWRIYNVKPDTASYWDINKVKTNEEGALQFPIQKFESPTTGSFAVYLLNNYNVNLTGKTLAAKMKWTGGIYKTRSTEYLGAYVRFWFQDVTSGPYDVNDYWWSTGINSLDLNAAQSGNLTVSLANRELWTNMAGMSATDDTNIGYVDWNGNTMKETPYDGFTNAMKKVKQMGLSFGSSGTYASGVAIENGTGIFTVSSFTITP
jgi:hypothetical protein